MEWSPFYGDTETCFYLQCFCLNNSQFFIWFDPWMAHQKKLFTNHSKNFEHFFLPRRPKQAGRWSQVFDRFSSLPSTPSVRVISCSGGGGVGVGSGGGQINLISWWHLCKASGFLQAKFSAMKNSDGFNMGSNFMRQSWSSSLEVKNKEKNQFISLKIPPWH